MSATPGHVDVLHVSPGTTAGWRRADAELRHALEQLGVSVATATSHYRLASHLRRTVLSTDLAEAAAMRRALDKALDVHRPRALIISSPQAAMLQPRRIFDIATAIRYDVPAAVNRQGLGSWILHALERRALKRARLLLPIGVEVGRIQDVGVATPMIALPIPVETPATTNDAREPLAIAYAGNPDKKGLDLVAGAWSIAAPGNWQLVVTGIEAERGRRYLRRRGVEEPPNLRWAGVLDQDAYAQLVSRASIFLAASRYEDYGIAQLEALAAGALLVTVPSEGPYEALGLARELNASLVAGKVSAGGLASSLQAAAALDGAGQDAYRKRARDLLRPYSRGELRTRLRDEVLPLLLGSQRSD